MFVGGLHPDTSEADMSEYFGQFGQVLEVNVMYDRLTNEPRGFGFVTFAEVSQADTVISYGKGHVLRGKNVDCKAATARKDAFVRGPDRERRPTSRDERWKRYHGDSHEDRRGGGHRRDPYDRDGGGGHRSSRGHSSRDSYGGHSGHSSSHHSSGGYSGGHSGGHSAPSHSHHGYGGHSAYPPPPTGHSGSHSAHSSYSHPPPAAAYPAQPHYSYPVQAVQAPPTTHGATASAVQAPTHATAPGTTAAASTSSGYYQHDTRYPQYAAPTHAAPTQPTHTTTAPSAHSATASARPPTYDYAHYGQPAYPYPYDPNRAGSGVTAKNGSAAAPTEGAMQAPAATRYDYYHGGTGSGAAVSRPALPAPVKSEGRQSTGAAAPTGYGAVRASAASNSAQRQRYSAY